MDINTRDAHATKYYVTNLELALHSLLVFCAVLLFNSLVVLNGFHKLRLDQCSLPRYT